MPFCCIVSTKAPHHDPTLQQRVPVNTWIRAPIPIGSHQQVVAPPNTRLSEIHPIVLEPGAWSSLHTRMLKSDRKHVCIPILDSMQLQNKRQIQYHIILQVTLQYKPVDRTFCLRHSSSLQLELQYWTSLIIVSDMYSMRKYKQSARTCGTERPWDSHHEIIRGSHTDSIVCVECQPAHFEGIPDDAKIPCSFKRLAFKEEHNDFGRDPRSM